MTTEEYEAAYIRGQNVLNMRLAMDALHRVLLPENFDAAPTLDGKLVGDCPNLNESELNNLCRILSIWFDTFIDESSSE